MGKKSTKKKKKVMRKTDWPHTAKKGSAGTLRGRQGLARRKRFFLQHTEKKDEKKKVTRKTRDKKKDVRDMIQMNRQTINTKVQRHGETRK